MASTDATPLPIKNQAYRITFPIFDADGDLVTGATGLDSEVSKDGGTFADCTSEATEIATSSGMYYLDLTSTEMNADTVAIIVKTTSSGAKTTPIVMYPAEFTDIPVDIRALGGIVQSATDLKDFADDGYDPSTNKVQGVVLTDTVTTYTGNTPQTGDSFARLGLPAGASVSADIAAVSVLITAVKAKTDQLVFTLTNKVDASIQAAGDFAQAAADKVWLTASRTLTAFGFSVTVGTNNDKTGYSLSVAGIQAIWDALTSALTTSGSIGKLLVDNINATISSRSSHSAADVWAVATRILTAGTNIVLAKGTGVTGFNDLSAAQVNTEVDTALADYDAPTSAELVTEINNVQADIAALNNISAAQVNAEVVDVLRTDTIPDSYSADGAQPTIAQAILAIHQFLQERSVTGTTVTVTKPNGSTVAMTFTLDNGVSPTSITRAT